MPPEKKNYLFSNVKPVVLVAPLDWGLGHATRCIPIITHFLAIGCEVIVASEGKQLALLQDEFSTIRFVKIKGYRLRYGKNRLSTLINILLQVPKIIAAIIYEHRWLNKLLLHHKVDAVVSDNRYGLYHRSVRSVFITHQLMIKTPFGRLPAQWLRSINYRLINQFNECWVPDFESNENLSGELSHPGVLPAIPVKYIGRLTRLRLPYAPAEPGSLLVIISGPEPQRSIFEEMLMRQLAAYPGQAVLVRGLPGTQKAMPGNNTNLVVYNHLPAGSLGPMISRSELIISRSGYSTVMDVIGRNRKCIFIPTPGQTEQEYLACYLAAKRLCLHYTQHRFSLEKALREAAAFRPAHFEDPPPASYEAAVASLVASR